MTGKAFINSLIGVLLKELTSLKNFDLKAKTIFFIK